MPSKTLITTPTAFEAMREALKRADMKLGVYARNHANQSDYGKEADKEYWHTIKPMIEKALAQAEAELQGEKPTQTMPERKLLEKFLAWNRRWPKSAVNMDAFSIAASEIDLDDLITDARTLLEKL